MTLLRLFSLLVFALLTILLVRTFMFSSTEAELPEPAHVSVDEEAVVANMSAAIGYKTISTGNDDTQDYLEFERFIEWVKQTYPVVQAELQLEMVADYTMLYTWKGRDESLAPILLTAHYDVVPIAPGSEPDWSYDPFAGDVADGYVWGRGALDDKSAVVVMLEAVTLLLNQGYVPERTVYFSFGHDEEIGGPRGAAGVTELLRSRGVQLAWSLDEGSFVTDGVIPGVDNLVALVNVAEKGSVTYDLIAHGPGGHSSMPEAEIPIDILANALVKLRANPLDGGLDGLGGEMIDGIARQGSFLLRVFAANKWLFGGLLERQLGQSASGNALQRTTTAPTLLSAGIKTNVITPTATATVNFRLHPRDTAETVKAHIERVINDPRVEVKLHGDGYATPASGVSSWTSPAYGLIKKVTKQVFGQAVVVPSLTMGGTDSKHYSQIADDSYRYQFMVVNAEDISGFHGTNERVSVENLINGTKGYYLLLEQAASNGD